LTQGSGKDHEKLQSQSMLRNAKITAVTSQTKQPRTVFVGKTKNSANNNV
jgi:hypothetical protein